MTNNEYTGPRLVKTEHATEFDAEDLHKAIEKAISAFYLEYGLNKRSTTTTLTALCYSASALLAEDAKKHPGNPQRKQHSGQSGLQMFGDVLAQMVTAHLEHQLQVEHEHGIKPPPDPSA